VAQNRRVYNGIGMIGLPSPLARDAEGKIPESEIVSLSSHIESMTRKLNGLLSLGDGSDRTQAGNLDAQWITLVTPASPGTEFEVWHGLQRVAIGYLVGRKTAACDVYDSNVGSWTDSLMLLKATAGSATINLLVF
jgi:hypothetical protein